MQPIIAGLLAWLPRTREAGRQPLLRLSSLDGGFVFSASPGTSVPSLLVGWFSLGCWHDCPRWWLHGASKTNRSGLGEVAHPIHSAGRGVGHSVPGAGGGRQCWAQPVQLVCAGRAWGNGGVTIRDRQNHGQFPVGPQDSVCGSPPLGSMIHWKNVECTDLTSLGGGWHGWACAPGASPSSSSEAKEAPPFSTGKWGPIASMAPVLPGWVPRNSNTKLMFPKEMHPNENEVFPF